jgi:hypothetical protein
MRKILSSLLLVCAAACRTSNLGTCAGNADCPSGSACDLKQSPPVCVATTCLPACDSAHVCDTSTLACVPADTAGVTITSPAGGAIVSGTLQAAASARAPGGVGAVRFELSSGGGVVATASGTAAPGTSPSYTASLPLSGIADGPATLQAIATFGVSSVSSAPVAVVVDQNAPVIALQTDGRNTLYAGGQTAAVTASITDGTGTGVQPSSVLLTIAGRAPIAGTAGAPGAYGFSVPIDDSVAPTGVTSTVPFVIAAGDLAGHAATLSGDPQAVLRVDRDAPAFGSVTIMTTPDYLDPSGRTFYDSGAVPLTVVAVITDGAGVPAAGTCLRVTGETGACAHSGTAGSANSFSFSLPRPSTPQDGSTPLEFTITAEDALASGLSGASLAEHQSSSAVQQVFFDNRPPSITVLPDTAPYARTLPDGGTNTLTISALIADPAGVALPRLNTTIAPSFVDGGLYQFPLDAKAAPAGMEANFTVRVSAQDNLGHAAQVDGTRFIDDVLPAVAGVRVFKDTDPGAGTPGVTYPAAVANTGYNGTSFVYSDTVHVKGTLTDLSGFSSAVLHVDGIGLGGGATAGVPLPLGCAASPCNFDLPVALNDPRNGRFHTGTAVVSISNAEVPSGLLQMVIEAQDGALAANGGPAPHLRSITTAARANRLLWRQSVNNAVTGLAVHPSGDVIATTSGGMNTVYDLAPDQPLVRWNWGATGVGAAGTSAMGPIDGVPAIGAGTAANAPVYVAGRGGSIAALTGVGSSAATVAWHADTGAQFAVGPAVANVTIASVTVEEVIVPDATAAPNSKVWTAVAGVSASVASAAPDSSSAPLVLNGAVYFGTNTGVERHLLGPPLAAGTMNANGGPNFGIVTDGTNLFVARNSAAPLARLYKLDPTLSTPSTAFWSALLPAAPGAEPTFGIDGKLYQTDLSPRTVTVDPATGAMTALTPAPSDTVRVPLQGSDGHFYEPRAAGFLYAFLGNAISWEFNPVGTINRAGTMDCQGRLFVASDAVVYALVSDDGGLADTPWPSMRRDARNTGNAGAPKYGMLTAAPCAQ